MISVEQVCSLPTRELNAIVRSTTMEGQWGDHKYAAEIELERRKRQTKRHWNAKFDVDLVHGLC